MILADFNPVLAKALIDDQHALTFEELLYFLEDIAIAREAHEERRALTQNFLKR